MRNGRIGGRRRFAFVIRHSSFREALPVRTLAIGDIHGCARALDALLGVVAPRPGDVVVTLGDYVDRGPDSRGVVERLLQLKRDCGLVPLLGNHEIMLREVLHDPAGRAAWLNCGGQATVRSYGARDDGMPDLPDTHRDFLCGGLLDYWETGTHLFAHAGADAELDLADQPPWLLFWEPFARVRPHRSGKVFVCGHSRQADGRPRDVGHAVCLDTGAFTPGGWLTCLDVGSRDVWQANERGEVRSFPLPAPPPSPHPG